VADKASGKPVTADTLFQAASISKPVSALLFMQLVQQGKLQLDTDVNETLTSWKLPSNDLTKKSSVTLRLLLSHMAGTTVHGFPGYAAGERLPTLIQILSGSPPANSQPIEVDMLPGWRWRYSGGGYLIAEQMAEDVTGGTPFAKLMQDRVLAPLGMTHSTFAQPLPKELAAQAATPYLEDGTAVQGGPHIYPELAPAGLWTTPSDLARYAIGMQAALAGKPHALLSRDTARIMLTPNRDNWGLGPQVVGKPGNIGFEHGGSNFGFKAEMYAYENGEGVIVMTNSDRGPLLAQAIIRTIAYEHHWPDLPPREREAIAADPARMDLQAGSYRFPNGMVITFSRDGNRFFARMRGQDAIELFPISTTDYTGTVVDATLAFPRGETGTPLQVTLYQYGSEQVATRLP
jgi:CubicO group peptidase (beta-lactamase class C family)